MKTKIAIILLIMMLISSIVVAFHQSDNTYTFIEKHQAEKHQDVNFTYGKALFKANCKGCHAEDMVHRLTAPSLGGITKKRNKDWLYKFTKNSLRMYKEGDSLAIAVGDKYWGVMTSFPSLSNADLDKIYYYVEKRYEMSLQGIPVPIEFEFKASENKNAKACTHILIDKEAVLNVAVSKNRNWTFGCKRTSHSIADWKKTTLKAMFDYDKSVNELVEITPEYPAFRTSINSHWDYKL
ncbi:c-type cytochrome [Kordia sp.]|uniref:c-type cytochrome n=1 Tax=Kordia sp. TaxID=1965332 RepID=UPI003D2A62D5